MLFAFRLKKSTGSGGTLYQGVEVVLDSLTFWQIALDGIQIGLCSLILIYLIRNKIKHNRFVLKPFPEEGAVNFKNDLWIQSLRQQAEQSFNTLSEIIERERRLFEKRLEMPGIGPDRDRLAYRPRNQFEKYRLPDPGFDEGRFTTTHDRYAEVKRMAGKGIGARQISENLKLPLNEVELILKLTQKIS